jgi:hypothetical protein
MFDQISVFVVFLGLLFGAGQIVDTDHALCPTLHMAVLLGSSTWILLTMNSSIPPIINAFHCCSGRPARWSNWMFEIDEYDTKSNEYTFGRGGNQGARGNNEGGDFFVENVFEELDYPGEFYHDKGEGKLYHWYNGTGAPPTTTKVVAPQKQVLVNLTGTQWEPVTDINMTNIKYTASSYTYMNPHAVPSAGDWALDRFGAIFLQGILLGVALDSILHSRMRLVPAGYGLCHTPLNRLDSILHSRMRSNPTSAGMNPVHV